MNKEKDYRVEALEELVDSEEFLDACIEAHQFFWIVMFVGMAIFGIAAFLL